jgi:hypothetical protein
MKTNLDTIDRKLPERAVKSPLRHDVHEQRSEGRRMPGRVDTPFPPGPASDPARMPWETRREPCEMPGSPPSEIPREPLPTKRDRERAENEGMTARGPGCDGGF